MQTLSDYLTEHPFHKYVYIFNDGIYFKPDGLWDLTVEKVEYEQELFRYVIYLKI